MKRLFSLFNVVSAALLVGAVLASRAVRQTPPAPDAPTLQLAERKAVPLKVYFPDTQLQRMVAESRTVQISQRNPAAVAQAALNVWAEGPRQSGHLAVVSKGTPAPKVYVRAQHYFVDLPAPYGNLRYGTSGERMLLCTITRTLLESRGQNVTFILNGKSVETLGHMDLREPFTRQDCTDQ